MFKVSTYQQQSLSVLFFLLSAVQKIAKKVPSVKLQSARAQQLKRALNLQNCSSDDLREITRAFCASSRGTSLSKVGRLLEAFLCTKGLGRHVHGWLSYCESLFYYILPAYICLPFWQGSTCVYLVQSKNLTHSGDSTEHEGAMQLTYMLNDMKLLWFLEFQ